MRKRALVNTVFMILLVSATGCATLETAGHKYIMKGQILEVTDGEAYLCIGSAEGAKAGQEFKVYSYTRTQLLGAKQVPAYKRELVGAVKIAEVVDEHYAKAKVVSGRVKPNDMAELTP